MTEREWGSQGNCTQLQATRNMSQIYLPCVSENWREMQEVRKWEKLHIILYIYIYIYIYKRAQKKHSLSLHMLKARITVLVGSSVLKKGDLIWKQTGDMAIRSAVYSVSSTRLKHNFNVSYAEPDFFGVTQRLALTCCRQWIANKGFQSCYINTVWKREQLSRHFHW
jgi:hypothetical protein